MRPSRLVALGVIAVLAGGASLTVGRGGAEEPTVVERKPAVERPDPTVKDSSTLPTPAKAATTTAVSRVSSGVLDVAEAGLDAWGRFAVDGDLLVVAPWFAPEGPQFARFEEESDAPGVGEPPYSVTLTDPRVVEDESRATVEGRVLFVRTGEPSQPFHWSIILHRLEGEWSIWTVEEIDPVR